MEITIVLYLILVFVLILDAVIEKVKNIKQYQQVAKVDPYILGQKAIQ